MNGKNKLILGMFSLAFASLAALQGVSKYINYSQSAVLGDETNLLDNLTAGKRNFFTCESHQECASLYCDPNAKRCIPKPSDTPIPTPSPTSTQSSPKKIILPKSSL